MKEKREGILRPHGGYKRLRSYKVAAVVYDATVVFCDRFIDKRSRTHDQMVQAARSGVRNISEASGAAATSSRTELKLTNVAKASLSEELLDDYISFLSQKGLEVWDKDSVKAKAMRERLSHDRTDALPTLPNGAPRLNGLLGLPEFVARAKPEIAANAMVCAINQAAYLLHRQIQSLEKSFIEEGGFTERMYQSRKESIRENTVSESCGDYFAGRSDKRTEDIGF